MTTYAYRPDTAELLAVWDTGSGSLAARVATVSDSVQGVRLADALTRFSSATWRVYTHPPTAVGDPEEINTDAWRRAGASEALDRVNETLAKPNLVGTDGILVSSYIPTEEAAHRVGRILYELADPHVWRDVGAETVLEVDAMRRADLGDLTGRAEQAVTLSRQEVSPTQVQAAWDILTLSPLNPGAALTKTFDPTAASAAAAACLRVAAQLASEVEGVHWTQAVAAADDVEALPTETPTTILELLSNGYTPTEAVLGLVVDALAIAEGEMPRDAVELAEDIEAAVELAGDHGLEEHALLPRVAVLDPRRPAPDLLEDLMSGIWGCFRLWAEHQWDDEAGIDEDEDEDGDAITAAQSKLFSDELVKRMMAVDRDSL